MLRFICSFQIDNYINLHKILAKVDTAASEYAKAIGKWGGTATTVWIAAQVPQINAVLEAARTWLFTLIP